MFRRRIFAGVLAGVLGVVTACAPLPERTVGTDVVDFRTDSSRYALKPSGSGYAVTVGVTYTNNTSGRVYFVNCNGSTAYAVEKRVAGEWAMVYSPVIESCLSSPIVIEPHGTRRFQLWLSSAYPEFTNRPDPSISDYPGTYRAVFAAALGSYQDSPPFGTPLPENRRVSNTFEILTIGRSVNSARQNPGDPK